MYRATTNSDFLIPPHTLSKPHIRHAIQSLLKKCGWLLQILKFLFADPEKTLLLPPLKPGLKNHDGGQ